MDLIARLAASTTTRLRADLPTITLPAGTEVWVRETAMEDANACAYVRVVGHERISLAVYKTALLVP